MMLLCNGLGRKKTIRVEKDKMCGLVGRALSVLLPLAPRNEKMVEGCDKCNQPTSNA